jgi:hypothetical protein
MRYFQTIYENSLRIQIFLLPLHCNYENTAHEKETG